MNKPSRPIHMLPRYGMCPPARGGAGRHHGAALLAAMLTVSLVATFAAAALWQQWRSIEVETAERARVQSEWILTGALDWARLLLREDKRAVDDLTEPWAVPLEEARLSSFLAADKNNTAESGPEVLDAFLSGQIVDLQSRLNVTNLIQADGKTSERDFEQFATLFDELGLPMGQLEAMTENLRLAKIVTPDSQSNPTAPLLPKRLEQLAWLGLTANTVAVLQPYVTILTPHTTVNLNTASAEVIYATVDGLSLSDAQRLVAARERAPFRSLDDAKRVLGGSDSRFAAGQVNAGWTTNFFEVRSRLRLDQLVVEERSVVQRDGMDVKILQRERVTPGQPAVSPEMSRR